MPLQSRMVLRYQSGKCPELQASVKLATPSGPFGTSDAISAAPAPPGRRLATTIQPNGTAHRRAAPHSSTATSQVVSRLIVDATFERAQRDHRKGEQESHAHHGGSGREPDVVV